VLLCGSYVTLTIFCFHLHIGNDYIYLFIYFYVADRPYNMLLCSRPARASEVTLPEVDMGRAKWGAEYAGRENDGPSSKA